MKNKKLPTTINFELPYSHALELMNLGGSLEEMIRYDWHNTQRIEADAKVKVLRMVDILRETFERVK